MFKFFMISLLFLPKVKTRFHPQDNICPHEQYSPIKYDLVGTGSIFGNVSFQRRNVFIFPKGAADLEFVLGKGGGRKGGGRCFAIKHSEDRGYRRKCAPCKRYKGDIAWYGWKRVNSLNLLHTWICFSSAVPCIRGNVSVFRRKAYGLSSAGFAFYKIRY